MTRPKNRRSLGFENLESRNLLSIVTAPTAQDQYMLELINQARTNPQAAALRLTKSITPELQDTLKDTLNYYHVDANELAQEIASAPVKAPLAWSSDLASAAQGHSQDMANDNSQSHTGSDGSSPQDRMEKAGYTNPATSGENVYAYAKSVDNAMQAFLLDWGVADQGHRRNIQQFNTSASDQYTDVGIGIVSTSASSSSSTVGPMLVTQDFASHQNEEAQLVGVAYYDNQQSGFYAMGEGQGGVRIDATNLATGQTTSAETWAAGGYQMALSPGDYKVTASQHGTVIQSVTVTINDQNVEQDFLLNRRWDGRSVSQVESSISPANSQTNSSSSWKSASVSAPALAVSSTSESNSASSTSPTSNTSATPKTSSNSTSNTSSRSAASQKSSSPSVAISSPVAPPASIPSVNYKPTSSSNWTTWKVQLD